MSYNLKYCSFYPNNFDASALTSVGVRMYLGRGTMTMWFISENKKVHLMEQEGSFNGTKKKRVAYNNC